MAVDEVAMDEATLLEAECTDYEIHVVIRENRLAYRWYRDGYLIAITSFPDFPAAKSIGRSALLESALDVRVGDGDRGGSVDVGPVHEVVESSHAFAHGVVGPRFSQVCWHPVGNLDEYRHGATVHLYVSGAVAVG